MNLFSSLSNKIHELAVSFSQSNKANSDIYPVCKHTIEEVNQDLFQLFDGSRWKVEETDLSIFKTWKPGSQVIIAGSDMQKFEIVNIDLEGRVMSSVKASLLMNPYQASKYENSVEIHATSAFEIVNLKANIIEINYLDPLIQYASPLRLEAMNSSKDEIKRWGNTDVIMIGLMHSPNHPEYNQVDLMLINCTLQSYIHARAI